MNLDRGAWQLPLEFARNEEWARHANLFRTEPTDPASNGSASKVILTVSTLIFRNSSIDATTIF